MTDQPPRTNSSASQSSNSGWVGRAPFRPKSLGVSTIPLPKVYCQIRFTITRAVNGLSGLATHSANFTRRSCSGASGASPSVPMMLNTSGATTSRFCKGSPRYSRWVFAGCEKVPAQPTGTAVSAAIFFVTAANSAPTWRAAPASAAGSFATNASAASSPPYGCRSSELATVFQTPSAVSASIRYAVATRSLKAPSRARLHTTRWRFTRDGNSIRTQPCPAVFEIQLRGLPVVPSFTCSSRWIA